MSASSRGHDRERAVRRLLEMDGWWVGRAAGSLGDADLVALRKGDDPMLIEVKANKNGGPYANFRRVARSELAGAAETAGAEAWLCWYPPRGHPRWISEDEWPEAEEAAA